MVPTDAGHPYQHRQTTTFHDNIHLYIWWALFGECTFLNTLDVIHIHDHALTQRRGDTSINVYHVYQLLNAQKTVRITRERKKIKGVQIRDDVTPTTRRNKLEAYNAF